jgi:hypothetical protein
MLLLFGHRIIGCSIKLPDYQTVHLIIFVQAAYIISSRSLHFFYHSIVLQLISRLHMLLFESWWYIRNKIRHLKMKCFYNGGIVTNLCVFKNVAALLILHQHLQVNKAFMLLFESLWMLQRYSSVTRWLNYSIR